MPAELDEAASARELDERTHSSTAASGGEYLDSSTVTLVANEYNDKVFARWNDSVTDNPRQILVVSDTAFTAFFRSPADTVGGRLSLHDMEGREVDASTVTGATVEWDVSRLPSGAYLVKLITRRGTTVQKMVIRD